VTYVVVGARCLLFVVFLVSAVSKLRGRERFTDFVGSVRAFGILPAGAVRPVAALVVSAEAAIAVLVAIPVTVVVGFSLAVGLLLVLTGALTVVVRRRQQVTCRCFGTGSAPVSRRHLVRNGLLIVIALVGAAGALSAPASAVHPAGTTLAIIGGATAALLVVHFDDIVDLFDFRSVRPDRSARPLKNKPSSR